MATCPNCGTQNAANQQFCVSCGAHLGGLQRTMSHVPIVTGVAPAPVMAPTMMPAQSMAPGPATAGQPKQVEIRPTWGLAWGLFWRMFFLWLFFMGIVFLCYMVVRMALGYTTVFGG